MRDDDDYLPKRRRRDNTALLAFGTVGLLFLAVIGTFVVIAVSRRGSTSHPGADVKSGGPSKGEKSPVSGVVDIQVLAQDYRTNQVSADEKYTGRRVTAEGSMKSLEKTAGGNSLMRFEYFVDGFNFREGIVQAIFPPSESSKLSKFDYRATVFFEGRCDGLEKIATGSIVVLRECVIVTKPVK